MAGVEAVLAETVALIGGVDDEGVFGEPFFIQFVEQLAAGLVEPFDHRIIARNVVGLNALGLVFLEQASRRRVRVVGK